MLKLEKVSKFYSSGGVVATGFSKVDLELEIGEFVAITGESGSGKSTLLNVISGLDSYEEGEMYVNGSATSGYTKEDMEGYRKKYIGNIFQTFNLINSYTVYQNVELSLLMSGCDSKDVEEKVHDIIAKVGLTEYEKTKASKLSGGQKQRVAIARALAKETPIIVADEPTGNLDSQSAAEVIELLHNLSKNKLIIIVTHNYDQVEKYVTRKISMHDGRIVEDKKLSQHDEAENFDGGDIQEAISDTLTAKNTVKLGIRNTFNIPAKFLLMLAVFVFLCGGIISSYTATMNSQDSMDSGYNEFFRDTRRERILVTKPDEKVFTKEDYKKLKAVSNVDTIVKNDISLDSLGYISDDSEFWIMGKITPMKDFKGRIEVGREPETAKEVVVMVPKEGYARDVIDSALDKKATFSNDYTGESMIDGKVKIVGYGYLTDEEEEELVESVGYCEGYFCLSDKGMNQIRYNALKGYSQQTGKYAGMDIEGLYLKTSEDVPEGSVIIGEGISSMSEYWPIGQELTIRNKSKYFDDTYKFSVYSVVTRDNCEYLLGAKNFDDVEGFTYMNPKDYRKMFEKGNYQSSVMVKDRKLVRETVKEIEELGYNCFYVRDGLVKYSEEVDTILKTMMMLVLAFTLIVLFFITYFIMKLILKSRNIYYSTIRMLGGTKGDCSNLIKVEVITVANIAFLICMGLVALVKAGFIHVNYLIQIVGFLNPVDCVIIYVVIIAMSILLAGRYSKALFKKTAMNAYKEEV